MSRFHEVSHEMEGIHEQMAANSDKQYVILVRTVGQNREDDAGEGNPNCPVILHNHESQVIEQYQGSETHSCEDNESERESIEGTHDCPYVCGVCGRGLTEQYDLVLHMADHNADGLFTCTMCGAGFSSETFLEKHAAVHVPQNIHVCKTCGEVFATSDRLTAHHLSIHAEIVQVHRSSEVRRYAVCVPRNAHECNLCGKLFKMIDELMAHHRAVHAEFVPMQHLPEVKTSKRLAELEPQAQSPHACNICGKQFAKLDKLVAHRKNEHQLVLAHKLSDQPMAQTYIPTDMDQVQGLPDVTRYTEVTEYEQATGLPKTTGLATESELTELYESVEFTGSVAVTGLAEETGSLDVTELVVTESLEETGLTEVTGLADVTALAEMTVPADLAGTADLTELIDEVTASSEVSGSTAEVADNFAMKNYSTTEKPFKCVVCDKSYRKRSHLTIHMRGHYVRHDSGIGPTSCDVCGVMFTSIKDLNTHKENHEAEPNSCIVMNKGFERTCQLKRPMQTTSVDNIFSCYICRIDFLRREDLKDHFKTHKEIFPSAVRDGTEEFEKYAEDLQTLADSVTDSLKEKSSSLESISDFVNSKLSKQTEVIRTHSKTKTDHCDQVKLSATSLENLGQYVSNEFDRLIENLEKLKKSTTDELSRLAAGLASEADPERVGRAKNCQDHVDIEAEIPGTLEATSTESETLRESSTNNCDNAMKSSEDLAVVECDQVIRVDNQSEMEVCKEIDDQNHEQDAESYISNTGRKKVAMKTNTIRTNAAGNTDRPREKINSRKREAKTTRGAIPAKKINRARTARTEQE